MSVSIYYSFKTKEDLAGKGALDDVCKSWNREFDGDPYESWCWYEPEHKNGNYKFEGATKMNLNEEHAPRYVFVAVQLLTDLRNKYGGNDWSVNLDDLDIHWDDDSQSFLLE